jgi:hypothetical protein
LFRLTFIGAKLCSVLVKAKRTSDLRDVCVIFHGPGVVFRNGWDPQQAAWTCEASYLMCCSIQVLVKVPVEVEVSPSSRRLALFVKAEKVVMGAVDAPGLGVVELSLVPAWPGSGAASSDYVLIEERRGLPCGRVLWGSALQVFGAGPAWPAAIDRFCCLGVVWNVASTSVGFVMDRKKVPIILAEGRIFLDE